MSESVPESQQFGNIILGGKNAHREESVGILRLHANGIGWKSKVAGNVVPIAKADLRAAEWIKIPHAYQLKVKAKGGFVYRFNGFRGQDKETVKGYCTATFGLEVEDSALSYKGWNWGQASVEGGQVGFKVEDKPAFEVPLTDIAQATAQKSEAVIEMVDDDTALDQDELLVEVRFHMPQRATGADAGAEDEMDASAAAGFVDLIKQSGDLEAAGASLLTLDDLQIQVPRGRYDVELTDKFMKLHGKTNDYKVLYSNVASLYLIPKPDGVNMALVCSLEHPLRQGATTYPHIVFQLPREDSLETEILLSESECSARFGDKLDKFESGDLPSVVAKVMSAFTKKKVAGIKSGGFNYAVTNDRDKSIRCSLKAAEGFLFPLDKAFIFLSNKPLLVDLERIQSIEFNRVDATGTANAARTFDITVHMKDMSTDLQFVNLERAAYKELFRFLTAKKLRIKNIASAGYGDAGGRGGGSDDDADDDPYMKRMQKEREAAMQAEAMDDEDDDSDDEDDEDFVAKDDSDVDEEYDEGESDDSEAGGGAKREKGKKDKGGSSSAPPKKRARDDDGSGSGSGSDDDDGDSDDSEAEKILKKESKKKAKMGILAGGKKDGKGKKKKAKKDPNAPKRGQSAFMLWMNGAGRAQCKQENPDLKVTEVGKRCGELWKEMGAEAKSVWEDKAKADKERYEREMAAYKGKGKAAADSDDEPEADGSGSDSD